MYPIEVKSGKTYSLKSLIRFKEKYKQRIGGVYVIHPKNLIEKDDILCIPPYLLRKVLSEKNAECRKNFRYMACYAHKSGGIITS